MNPTFAKNVLAHIATSSALTKRALDELQIHRAAQTKAASLRSEVLKKMLDTGCATEQTKQAAEAMLGSHAETLGLLRRAMEKLAEFQTALQKQASDLGQGVDSKEAGAGRSTGSYNSLEDGYTGRRTSQMKESDRVLFKGLGL